MRVRATETRHFFLFHRAYFIENKMENGQVLGEAARTPIRVAYPHAERCTSRSTFATVVTTQRFRSAKAASSDQQASINFNFITWIATFRREPWYVSTFVRSYVCFFACTVVQFRKHPNTHRNFLQTIPVKICTNSLFENPPTIRRRIFYVSIGAYRESIYENLQRAFARIYPQREISKRLTRTGVPLFRCYMRAVRSRSTLGHIPLYEKQRRGRNCENSDTTRR